MLGGELGFYKKLLKCYEGVLMAHCTITPSKHSILRFHQRRLGRYIGEDQLESMIAYAYNRGDYSFEGLGIQGPRFRIKIPLLHQKKAVTIVEKIRECHLKLITVWIESS